MVDTTKVTPEITRELVARQLQLWRNTMEDLRIQAEVSRAIGDNDERQKPIRDEMARCIKAIEKLQAMLDEAK